MYIYNDTIIIREVGDPILTPEEHRKATLIIAKFPTYFVVEKDRWRNSDSVYHIDTFMVYIDDHIRKLYEHTRAKKTSKEKPKIEICQWYDSVTIKVGDKSYSINQEETHKLLKQLFEDLGYETTYEDAY